MDHANHMPLHHSEFTAHVLADAPVYDAQDRKIGTISHVHGHGRITGVVVDVGGFLGIGAKPVLLNVSQVNMMRDESGRVHGTTDWTKDQLKSLPEHRH